MIDETKQKTVDIKFAITVPSHWPKLKQAEVERLLMSRRIGIIREMARRVAAHREAPADPDPPEAA